MAKTIPLKEVHLAQKPGPDSEPAKYSELIRTVVGSVMIQSGGAEISEIRKRVRILDALDALEGGAEELILEDADAEALLGYLKTFKWGVISSGIVQFHDDIEKAVK